MLTNKSHYPEYKWKWFENRVSGSSLNGDGDDNGLGNSRGKNSVVDPKTIDTDQFGVVRAGGAEITSSFFRGLLFGMDYLDFVNDLTDGRVDKNYDQRYTKTQIQLDSIRLDSIYQNEIVPYDTRFVKNIIPKGWGGWNDMKETQIILDIKTNYSKRKDLLNNKSRDSLILIRKMDSILKK